MASATQRILLAGGGSGGHAYPLIAIARALQEEAQKKGIPLELMIIGSGGGFLEKAAQESGIRFKRILAGKLRRYISPLTILDLIKLPIGFIQSLWYLWWFMPDLVFVKGGYDAVAPALVGKLYLIPLAIHESDTVPGLANRILAPFSRVIFTSFKSSESAFKNRTVMLVGNPLRKELLSGDRASALEFFKFSPERKTILVMGGSLGAKQINDIILDSLVLLVNEYQVIHQCGETQYKAVKNVVDTDIKEGKQGYGQEITDRYRVYPFLDAKQMAMAYAAADVIVSRAGAGSLFEIAALGKPGIIVPIADSSNGHQLTNAVEFTKFGGILMEGSNLTTHILLNEIKTLLEPAKYADVSQKIKQFATPDAAEKIAIAILG